MNPTAAAAQTTPDAESLLSIQQQVRRTLPKETLRSWMELRPARVYRDIFLSWAGILGTLVAVSLVHRWWMYPLAFFVIGWCQYALFIVGHDALHSLLHPDREVNDRLARWLIHGPFFIGLENSRRFHLEHHRTLGTADDPDRVLHTMGNKNTRVTFLAFALGFFTVGAAVLRMLPFGRALLPPVQAKTARPKVPFGTYLKERAPTFLVQAGLFGLMLLLGLPFWAYFALWMAPVLFCVFLADGMRAFCDHAVPDLDDEAANPYRLVSFEPTLLESVCISPHNMNFHAEHHLWLGVPYYNLPKAHAFLRDNPRVTVRRGYFAFLWRLFTSLPTTAPRS